MRPPQHDKRTASPKIKAKRSHRVPIEVNSGQGRSPHRAKNKMTKRTGYWPPTIKKIDKNIENKSFHRKIKQEDWRTEDSPHHTSYGKIKEDWVLGTIFLPSNAVITAVILNKTTQKQKNILIGYRTKYASNPIQDSMALLRLGENKKCR